MDYIKACLKIVIKSPHKSRYDIDWINGSIQKIEKYILERDCDFFSEYTFDSWTIEIIIFKSWYMTEQKKFHYPIAIGGVGGSGTRLVALFLLELGFYLGNDLNIRYKIVEKIRTAISGKNRWIISKIKKNNDFFLS